MESPVEIVDLDTYEPTDDQIVSWYEMMIGPDQLLWEYDESWASETWNPEDEVQKFRARRDKQRGTNHPLWAIANGRVVGMIGINRHTDNAHLHSAELGFGVAAQYARQGIGCRLLRAALEKARELGLKRLEADCFADNVASIGLMHKCGFVDEGLRRGSICKNGELRDTRMFGILL